MPISEEKIRNAIKLLSRKHPFVFSRISTHSPSSSQSLLLPTTEIQLEMGRKRSSERDDNKYNSNSNMNMEINEETDLRRPYDKGTTFVRWITDEENGRSPALKKINLSSYIQAFFRRYL